MNTSNQNESHNTIVIPTEEIDWAFSKVIFSKISWDDVDTHSDIDWDFSKVDFSKLPKITWETISCKKSQNEIDKQ